ncbi:hypothetical protein H2248_009123 [Termitomyces sp. 'cryptogamus']|nr:hypothetical protein H2248_009123 [Termitomyces sp. 'cryptogamus']
MYYRIFQTLLFLFSPLIYAAITNRTIDDTHGDLVTGAKPIYLPGPWQHSDCGGCAIKPPLDNVFMQTYSAFTYMEEKFPSMSIQFSFQGTAIYVYFILANFVNDGVTTETLCDFLLDGVNVSRFHHDPTSSREYEFNALAFAKDNLTNNNHTLLISTSGVNRHLFTSFDYANYTFDDTPATSSASSFVTQQQSPTTTPTSSRDSHSMPIGVIIGGTVGGILILSMIIIIFLCLRRKRYRSFLSSPGGNVARAFTTRWLPPPALTQGTLIEPYTFTAASNPRRPTLPPAYNNNASSNDETSSTSITSTRQAEIEDQIRGLTREMQALAGVENDSKQESWLVRPSFSFRRSRTERAYLTQVQQQMDVMRAQIEYLQAQLHSNWAYGLRDDPPPSYSVIVRGERGRDLPIQFP